MSDPAFEATYGFSRAEVHLGNWRNVPWSRWAFRHVSELVPTARIAATAGLTEDGAADAADFIRQQVSIAGERSSVAEILARTSTDALAVMKSGRFVADVHTANFDLRSRHILFSASKSVTGVVAGILASDGLIDVDAPVPRYVPELARSAYADARVRDVLDMRVSVAFSEVYVDPQGDFARYRRAGLFEPSLPGERPETLLGFLASLKKGVAPHSGPFTYASPNSDVLGLVIERASGRRFADVATERLWQPLGARQDAYITVDAAGSARTGGGLCMTPRDLARLGEMMRQGGMVDGRRIVGEGWVADTIHGGCASAWRQGRAASWLPNGRYRNKWYQTGEANQAFFALGIHGQWLYVDPRNEIVAAKFGSQPIPSSDDLKRLNLALFAALPDLL